MDLARKRDQPEPEPAQQEVSNLVVMDLARKRTRKHPTIGFPTGFKPCCNGFSSEADAGDYCIDEALLFQTLL